jgi:hypothetical protein
LLLRQACFLSCLAQFFAEHQINVARNGRGIGRLKSEGMNALICGKGRVGTPPSERRKMKFKTLRLTQTLRQLALD